MLEIRPSCEQCNKELPPDSTEANICSFECTFCSGCVELLQNVCPNCGGGFVSRPIRVKIDWKSGNCLKNYPASKKIVLKTITRKNTNIFFQKKFFILYKNALLI